MLKLSHLTIRHTKDLLDLVRDLSLTIREGEKVAIIGEEGNGKSSLLHVLMSPKSLPDYLSIEGEITTSFHSYAYIPQALPEALKGITLEEYFFGEDELDYATLYRLADQLQFDSTALQAAKLLEVYLEEKPSKSNYFTNFVVLMNCYF